MWIWTMEDLKHLNKRDQILLTNKRVSVPEYFSKEVDLHGG